MKDLGIGDLGIGELRNKIPSNNKITFQLSDLPTFQQTQPFVHSFGFVIRRFVIRCTIRNSQIRNS